MDGYEATRTIRLHEQQEGRKHLLIIGLSANIGEEAEAKARQCGMDDYLTKPIQSIELEDKISSYFSLSHTQL